MPPRPFNELQDKQLHQLLNLTDILHDGTSECNGCPNLSKNNSNLKDAQRAICDLSGIGEFLSAPINEHNLLLFIGNKRNYKQYASTTLPPNSQGPIEMKHTSMIIPNVEYAFIDAAHGLKKLKEYNSNMQILETPASYVDPATRPPATHYNIIPDNIPVAHDDTAGLGVKKILTEIGFPNVSFIAEKTGNEYNIRIDFLNPTTPPNLFILSARVNRDGNITLFHSENNVDNNIQWFSGNSIKNQYISENPTKQSNIDFFVLCKELGDTLQVVILKYLIDIKYNHNHTVITSKNSSLFTIDRWVAARSALLGVPCIYYNDSVRTLISPLSPVELQKIFFNTLLTNTITNNEVCSREIDKCIDLFGKNITINRRSGEDEFGNIIYYSGTERDASPKKFRFNYEILKLFHKCQIYLFIANEILTVLSKINDSVSDELSTDDFSNFQHIINGLLGTNIVSNIKSNWKTISVPASTKASSSIAKKTTAKTKIRIETDYKIYLNSQIKQIFQLNIPNESKIEFIDNLKLPSAHPDFLKKTKYFFKISNNVFGSDTNILGDAYNAFELGGRYIFGDDPLDILSEKYIFFNESLGVTIENASSTSAGRITVNSLSKQQDQLRYRTIYKTYRKSKSKSSRKSKLTRKSKLIRKSKLTRKSKSKSKSKSVSKSSRQLNLKINNYILNRNIKFNKLLKLLKENSTNDKTNTLELISFSDKNNPVDIYNILYPKLALYPGAHLYFTNHPNGKDKLMHVIENILNNKMSKVDWDTINAEGLDYMFTTDSSDKTIDKIYNEFLDLIKDTITYLTTRAIYTLEDLKWDKMSIINQ